MDTRTSVLAVHLGPDERATVRSAVARDRGLVLGAAGVRHICDNNNIARVPRTPGFVRGWVQRCSSQMPSLWHQRGRPLRGQACGSHSPRTPCARGLRLHPVGGFLWKDLFVRCTLSGTNKGCTVATQALTLDATNAEVAKLAEYLDTALQSGRACVNLTMSCGRRWTDVVDNHHHSFRRARRPAGCGCAPSGGAVCVRRVLLFRQLRARRAADVETQGCDRPFA